MDTPVTAVKHSTVMPDHPNLALFRHIYEAFTSGDMDTLATSFASDVVWHTGGNNPLSGDFTGRDATFEAFAKEFELSNGSYEVDVHDALADDEHIVAILHARAQREGKALDEDYVIVFNVSAGLVTEAWELWVDQPSVDAFWS